MRKILLHICCAPCSIHVIDILKNKFEYVVGYFYNPNIQPENEYQMRLNEMNKFSKQIGFDLIEAEYNTGYWNSLTAGLEEGKEGGERCSICYRIRLEKSAEYAKNNNIDYFTTVLSISPHKNVRVINQIGLDLSAKIGIKFFEADFKKKNGFKLSVQKSKEYNLIRQNYCGCAYSKR